MRLDMLFENFEMLADAPNGVPKLREMILQYAVQGKLVPQDPNDEPASVLLEKIKIEKETLVRNKKIKSIKHLTPIEPYQLPFEIPESWKWGRIRHVTYDLGQKKPDKEFTYIDVTSIDKERGIISDEPKILSAEEAPSRARKIVKYDTVIYSTVRPYLLNIAIVDRHFTPEPIVSTAFSVLHPYKGINNRYLYYYLRSYPFIKYVEKEMTGMAYPAINDTKMNIGPIPIPPTDEQKRIVTKVDQLMVICDELEVRKKKRKETRIALNEASLDTLLNTENKNEFSKNWQRIASNFDMLYDTPETVNKLRQAILQLAVQGKLVPQDPNDPPASVLLGQIQAEKKRLIKENKIKKTTPLPPIEPDEASFQLPKGWEWERLGNLTSLITKGSSPKWQGINYVEEDEGILFITSENVNNFTLNLTKKKYVETGFNEIEPRSILMEKDILMNIVGASIGRTAVFNLNLVANINQAVCLIRLIKPEKYLSIKYLLNFLNSYTCISYMFEKQVNMARANLSMGNISNFKIPIPSLEEQKRIVGKVDQLMTLCDELETKLSQSQNDCDELLYAIFNSIENGVPKGNSNKGSKSNNHHNIKAETDAETPEPVKDSFKSSIPERSQSQRKKSLEPQPQVRFERPDVLRAYRKAIYGKDDIDESTLLQSVGRHLGIMRLSKQSHDELKSYIRTAIRRKIIVRNGDRFNPGTPTIQHYEDDHLIKTLRSQIQSGYEYPRDFLINEAAWHLGFDRVSDAFLDRMKSIFRIAIRQGQLYRNGSYVGIP